MLFSKVIPFAALLALLSPTALIADVGTLTDSQKAEIQTIVHDYLINNPNILLEMSQILQKNQQENMQKEAKSAIIENANQLFANNNLTVIGNPKGDVTLVEFFDYQCIHCKKAAPIISELVKSDKNLRVIYKEFPIFGKSSDKASRAALAAAMQNKYLVMHTALLKEKGRLNDELIKKAAISSGLNMKKFKADIDSEVITQELAKNRELAEKLHLMGTPAFIIASTPGGEFKSGSEPVLIPGAASMEALQEIIKKAS